MRKIASSYLFAAILILAPSLANAQENGRSAGEYWWEKPLWTDPGRGFNWYPPPPIKKEDAPKQEEPPKPEPKSIYEMTSMEDVQKELTRLRGVAILNPTDENTLGYLKAQTWAYDKSQKFANVATRVTWQNPEVDYNNQSPVANFALQTKGARLDKSQQDNMHDLARNNGLIFFARSDCPYCRDQAPVLQFLSQKYGMDVLPISLDGVVLDYVPQTFSDNGISYTLTDGKGIQTVPALYLVSRDTRAVTPLGTGVLSAEEITRRIYILTKTDATVLTNLEKP